MPWIKAIDKYPDGFKLARKIGDDKSMPVMFAPHVIAGADGKTYKKEDLEYFDTTEPSFTIDDIKGAWHNGYDVGAAISNPDKTFESYVKEEYNINITK